MARRGAATLRRGDEEDRESGRVRRDDQVGRERLRSDGEAARSAQWVPEELVAAAASRRDASPRPRSAPPPSVGAPAARTELPRDVVAELASAVGRAQGHKLAQRMAAAVRAYERDRYAEALRTTRALVDEVPESASVRELHGLVCYRSGRWREAVKHLQAARSLSGGDPSQIPVLMDCERAMGHRRRVEQLWEELRGASAPADVLVEGRLVLAADLAERERLGDAIGLLTSSGGARNLRRPGARHVRQWYVLADLHERAGDLPRARELFSRVVAADPDMADAVERLAALGRTRPGRARRRR